MVHNRLGLRNVIWSGPAILKAVRWSFFGVEKFVNCKLSVDAAMCVVPVIFK